VCSDKKQLGFSRFALTHAGPKVWKEAILGGEGKTRAELTVCDYPAGIVCTALAWIMAEKKPSPQAWLKNVYLHGWGISMQKWILALGCFAHQYDLQSMKDAVFRLLYSSDDKRMELPAEQATLLAMDTMEMSTTARQLCLLRIGVPWLHPDPHFILSPRMADSLVAMAYVSFTTYCAFVQMEMKSASSVHKICLTDDLASKRIIFMNRMTNILASTPVALEPETYIALAIIDDLVIPKLIATLATAAPHGAIHSKLLSEARMTT
jgi:hypothetical protein